MRVSDGLWMEEEERADGARRLLGAGVSALRLHRHRQQRSGDAAAKLRGEGNTLMHRCKPQELLQSQNNMINIPLFFSWIRKSCLFPAELLHSQNIIHLRLRQKEALHAVSKDVLWQQRRHRRLPQQENQGHLKTFEKKAVPQKCRPWVHSPFISRSMETPTMLLRRFNNKA